MTAVSAATFDDALRGCIDEQFPGKAPIQAFPMDMEAAGTTEGPPECAYRVPIGPPGATEGQEERIVVVQAEEDGGIWTFTYKHEADGAAGTETN
ncbi:MAG: hypothetical protein V5A56_10860 [Halolamina sp.]